MKQCQLLLLPCFRKQKLQLLKEDKAFRTRTSLFAEKNATPGDAPQSVSSNFNEVRPVALCLDRTTASASDPAALRQGAVERFCDLHVQTGAQKIFQWHSTYFSQVMPFVIPKMVSGPDYDPGLRWRRKFEDSLLTESLVKSLLLDLRGE